jgi:6,7-dimethyl-8-ribityllumazine synthase
VRTFEGTPEGHGRRVGIVAARFNEVVTKKLLDGCLATLRAAGVADVDIDVSWVPGAFEIPSIAGRLARTGTYDAIVCLGAVIRGDTAHFQLVAQECARGVREVTRDTGVPAIFEVLATEDLPQALDRAGGAHGNKGRDAALTALEMASLLEALPKEGDRP